MNLTPVTTAFNRRVNLTDVQIGVFLAFGAGKMPVQIARERSCSVTSVTAQLDRLQDKLDCQTRAELRSLASGWIQEGGKMTPARQQNHERGHGDCAGGT